MVIAQEMVKREIGQCLFKSILDLSAAHRFLWSPQCGSKGTLRLLPKTLVLLATDE